MSKDKPLMFEINDTDDLERLEEDEDNIAEQLMNFGNANFEEDIRKALSQAIEEEQKSTQEQKEAPLNKPDFFHPQSSKDIEEYNSIFDKMDEEDESVIPTFGSEINLISQSLEDIKNDFPGIDVQENNFMFEIEQNTDGLEDKAEVLSQEEEQK